MERVESVKLSKWRSCLPRKRDALGLGAVMGTWIDVGAYHGEATLLCVRSNPKLCVYAFEPNLRAAVGLMGQASNFYVIPMAVGEHDGVAVVFA